MIIAIDFDGTIVEYDYPNIGKLKPYAKEIINKLYKKGHFIIIWTCRYLDKDLDEMIKFLALNNIKYHKVNRNCGFISFNSYPKIYADIYIDDSQIGGLPSWKEIYKIITRKEFDK